MLINLPKYVQIHIKIEREYEKTRKGGKSTKTEQGRQKLKVAEEFEDISFIPCWIDREEG